MDIKMSLPAVAKQSKSFTLIEVMIAVSLIAIALVILLHSVGISIELSNQSKFISIAPLLAQERMSEAEASGSEGLNNASGDFGEEYPDISWETVVTNGPDADLKQVEVRVSRGEGKWKSDFELVTYIVRTNER